mgnify:CR=1 FL=1
MMNIDELFSSLENGDEKIRKRAIEELGRNADMRAIPALMKLSRGDENLEVRFLAKKVLNDYRRRIRGSDDRSETEAPEHSPPPPEEIPGPATGSGPGLLPPGNSEIEDIERALRSPRAQTRVKAIMALVQIKDPQALSRLRRLEGREENSLVRAALVLAVGLMGSKSDLDFVRSFFSEKNPKVRCNAIEALLRLGGDSCARDLVQALKDKSIRVKNRALEALIDMDPQALALSLQKMLQSGEKSSRDLAAYALLKLERRDTIPLIVGLLADPEMSIRLKARNTLVNLAKNDCPEASEVLERLAGKRKCPDEFMTISVLERRPYMKEICHPQAKERLRAINAIVEAEDRQRIPHLLQALIVEKDEYVRAKLVIALGRLKAREAIPSLKLLCGDEIPRVRANAIEALGEIGDKESYPMLISFLEDANNRVRANAIVALQSYDLVDLKLPIEEMLDHEQELMRRSAIWAITEIRRPSFIKLLSKLVDDEDERVRKQARAALSIFASEGFHEASRIIEREGLE